MTYRFQCPACYAYVTGSNLLAGRRVRCPECDALVQASEPATGTVALVPSDDRPDGTVLLEAVEVHEAVDTSTPVQVTEVVEPPPIIGSGRPPAEPPAPPAAIREPELAPMRPHVIDSDPEMDMTPMVDMTFLLLIFFMVTATFTMQRSLEVPRPPDDDPSTTVVQEDRREQSDLVIVRVDEHNTFHVATVDWEEEAPSEQDLFAMLRKARVADRTGITPTRMRVVAHGESRHEKVVSALDAGTATGFEEVELTTVEDE
jgi:biopolymer transport protein ExbD